VNARRIAAILRKRAALDIELAEAFEQDAPPAPAANDTRPKYARRGGKASAEDVARAAEVLKRRGVLPSGRS